MSITEAIKRAASEHVVYFLLTAYVETLDHYDSIRRSLPERVKRLPLAGKSDVAQRSRALRNAVVARAPDGCDVRRLIREAAEVFCAASHRLRILQGAAPA